MVAGSGHDELIDAHADATVMVESSGDEVMVSGHDDRVLCSRRARDDVIYEGKSDSIGATCRADHDRVLPVKSFTTVRSVARAVAVVPGQGTDADPYVAPCDNPSVILADCIVSSFPARTLSGLWANEYVPAYRCPNDHPLLLAQNYAPFGTSLPRGVEVTGLGPIGVSIAGESSYLITNHLYFLNKATGTLTARGNSATNWTLGRASYQMILHCTVNSDHGYEADSS